MSKQVTDSLATDSQQKMLPLATLEVGPWPHCTALVWEKLADFESWPQWLSACRSLRRLDSGPPGRGSRLQIDGDQGSQIWEIVYWEPDHRLDIEIAEGEARCGYSIQLCSHPDAEYADIELYIEFASPGRFSLLDVYRRRKFRKLALRFLAEFSQILQPNTG